MYLPPKGKNLILALGLFAVMFLMSPADSAIAGPPATSPSSTGSETLGEKANTVVYYFHGNMRCYSCRKIEAYTLEAIRTGFADELKNGRLDLRVVNVEEAGNEHYVQDFQLYTRSVVIEKRTDGKRQEWKNLDKVWRLTRDKAAFMDYVQRETQAMMEGGDLS